MGNGPINLVVDDVSSELVEALIEVADARLKVVGRVEVWTVGSDKVD